MKDEPRRASRTTDSVGRKKTWKKDHFGEFNQLIYANLLFRRGSEVFGLTFDMGKWTTPLNIVHSGIEVSNDNMWCVCSDVQACIASLKSINTASVLRFDWVSPTWHKQDIHPKWLITWRKGRKEKEWDPGLTPEAPHITVEQKRKCSCPGNRSCGVSESQTGI